MNIAIAQVPMRWTILESLAVTEAALHIAAQEGSHLAVFPELSATGFHREVPQEITRLESDNSHLIDRLRTACQSSDIAGWFGIPYFEQSKIFNSYLLISSSGEVLCKVDKNGLMPNEHRLFTPGNGRPCSNFKAIEMSAVICREVADTDAITHQFAQQPPEILVWPGYVSNLVAEDENVPDGTKAQAAALAAALGCVLIQCNWADALNQPGRQDLGGSSVINHLGEVVWNCPWGKSGLGIIEVDRLQCRWLESDFDR